MAVALGVVSGLGAPGATLPLQTLLFAAASRMAGMPLGAPEFDVASAVNLALALVDLWLWEALFMRLGAQLLPPGGRYLRPFVAGLVPWLVAAGPAAAALFAGLARVFAAVMPAAP